MKIFRELLKKHDLKITPQRLNILEALSELKNHPGVDDIYEHLTKKEIELPRGTIYNVLQNFVDFGLVKMLKTDKDKMRYDVITDNHHHLYCVQTGHIKDYHDEELNIILKNYFDKKKIEGFEIKEINLHIAGKCINTNNNLNN